MRWSTLVLSALLVLFSGCAAFGSGVRKLHDEEAAYFKKLEKELRESDEKLKKILANLAVVEETALEEVWLLDANISNAKLVYSVREILALPGIEPEIARSRNMVVLYHLADNSSNLGNALFAAKGAAAERRKQLLSLNAALIAQVEATRKSGEAIHNALNQDASAQLLAVVHEVGRQLDAYNEQLAELDRDTNATVARFAEFGEEARERTEDVEKGLKEFIKIWSQIEDAGE